ncbi:MAG: DUF2817 domain-containing protein [Planctomycetes bacterium]|nr:DUF2817 domain-containing protein [Planctomycetota bacterium]
MHARWDVLLGLVSAVMLCTGCQSPAPSDPYTPDEVPIEDRPAFPEAAGVDAIGFEVRSIGESRENRPIELLRFPGREGKSLPPLLYMFSIHGNEVPAAQLAEAFVDSWKASPRSFQRRDVLILPVANPDGLERGTRTNAKGVDVNRNFPASNWSTESRAERYDPGSRPSSEPETRALVRLIEDVRPAAIVTVHAPLACVNWDGPADDLAGAMSEASGLTLKPSIGYPTPGSMGSYVGLDLKIPIVTLELGRTLPPEEIPTQIEGLDAALRYLDGGSG